MTIREHTFQIGESPRFEVSIASGEVRLRNGAAGTISLTVESQDADQVEVTRTGDTVVVRRPNSWSGRRRRVNVVATVPAGTDIDVNAVSADMRLDGRYGTTRLRTVSGDVEIGDIGRADVGSTSGDVDMRSSGALEVSSVSGDITVGHVKGRLRASLTSGDLRADEVDGDAEVSSMSGDIHIGRCGGDDINARSVSGDVRVGLPGGIRVEPDISTVSGSTSLPQGPAASTDGPRRRVRLRLRTVSGDIRIDRA